MKARQVLLLALGAVTALFVLGCGLTSVSIDQRISSFTDNLNLADRGSTWKDFHPELTQDVVSNVLQIYDWSVPFPVVGVDTPYSITVLNETDPSNVTATIDGPAAFFGPKNLKLVMQLYGIADWRIQELWMDSGTPPLVQLIK
jgi:hypothetical protein